MRTTLNIDDHALADQGGRGAEGRGHEAGDEAADRVEAEAGGGEEGDDPAA